MQFIEDKYCDAYTAFDDGDADKVRQYLEDKYVGENLLSKLLTDFGCNPKIVKAFIEQGADVNTTNEYGQTALMLATKDGNESLFHDLLYDYNADISLKSNDNTTLLMFAAMDACHSNANNKMSILTTIIDKGADVNAKNDYGCTALHYCTEDSGIGCAALLLANGADVNATDNKGRTPLITSCYTFISEGDQWIDERSNSHLVKLFLKFGANPNVKDAGGNTALMYAMKFDFFEAAKILLDYVTDINIRINGMNNLRSKGWTFLMFAAFWDSVDMATILIEKGIDVDAKNNNGNTAFIIAACQGNSDLVELLIANGADVNATDNEGRTALLRIVTRIIENENTDYKDDHSQIHSMSGTKYESHYYQTFKILLDSGANTEMKDKNGMTALMYAQKAGCHKTLEWILKSEYEPTSSAKRPFPFKKQ
jgi:ankyrin repeat protein